MSNTGLSKTPRIAVKKLPEHRIRIEVVTAIAVAFCSIHTGMQQSTYPTNPNQTTELEITTTIHSAKFSTFVLPVKK